MVLPLDLFDYELPSSLVAQQPLAQRDRSRLLLLRRGSGGCTHRRFFQIAELLPAGALLVVNITKVLPRRLYGRLPGGVKVEALVLDDLGGGRWTAMVKRARRLKPGGTVEFADGRISAEAVRRTPEGHWILAFADPATFLERLTRLGHAPLPPYIKREPGSATHWASDRAAYQTCFARNEGAIAVPTAGLHFTPAVLEALGARGIGIAELTLHVGLGTFGRVENGDARLHKMAREWYEIPVGEAEKIRAAKGAGRPVIAVGTTTVRALESWALLGSPPGQAGWSDLFIHPPFSFQVVDGLITNFHQPRSTLLMLIAAFHGRERTLAAYREAIREAYRFFSYGDCMAILPAGPAAGDEG